MSRRSRPHWRRISAGIYGKGGTYQHELTGARVTHCGHATALYPYTAELADGREPCMIAERKMPGSVNAGDSFLPKFAHLADCQQWIEGEWKTEPGNEELASSLKK
jgi:hypothetical protein